MDIDKIFEDFDEDEDDEYNPSIGDQVMVKYRKSEYIGEVLKIYQYKDNDYMTITNGYMIIKSIKWNIVNYISLSYDDIIDIKLI